jgi:hypothetical protein
MRSTRALTVALLLSAVLVTPTIGVAAGASTPFAQFRIEQAGAPSLSEEIARKEAEPQKQLDRRVRSRL